jgi:hypothetical protein
MSRPAPPITDLDLANNRWTQLDPTGSSPEFGTGPLLALEIVVHSPRRPGRRMESAEKPLYPQELKPAETAPELLPLRSSRQATSWLWQGRPKLAANRQQRAAR